MSKTRDLHLKLYPQKYINFIVFIFKFNFIEIIFVHGFVIE